MSIDTGSIGDAFFDFSRRPCLSAKSLEILKLTDPIEMISSRTSIRYGEGGAMSSRAENNELCV
jgi:hypothetical protein